jgi:hypothetical protein
METSPTGSDGYLDIKILDVKITARAAGARVARNG